ncbi:MAG: 3-phosphoshikimate 1-carboxyvinyltransferase [Ruminococcaceae bacterium]|nr:3-phosphoshikimate 1-carboxyvinyltransferase [Oscillospiraceae bacterium]
MTVTITKGVANGRIYAPPSKSMAHRDLICAALSAGSTVKRIDYSDDIKATLTSLAALGADVKINGSTVYIGGLDPFNPKHPEKLYCHESGSTLRFLVPLCLLSGKETVLSGKERLFERPLNIYEDICRKQGIYFKSEKSSLTVKGVLNSGKYEVAGNISSQFISGLLFALPLLAEDSIIDITGALESASYIKLTLKALGDFGIRVTRTDETTFLIPGSQRYKARELAVDGDYSNAAFLESFNLFGGNVMVEGLSEESFQGDRVYREHFKTLCESSPTIDLADCPDLAPILFAVAAAKNGGVFTSTARLRIKESDRAVTMQQELAKFGIDVMVEENRVVVKKGELHRPVSKLLGHNDHRIVMALSILCSLTGGTIIGAEAVNKSYPRFFDDIKGLGVNLEVED